jgi:hypothetical protein
MREAIAIPEASSLALFTRVPEDKRCIEVLNAPCEEDKLRCAFVDAKFVLIVEAIQTPMPDRKTHPALCCLFLSALLQFYLKQNHVVSLVIGKFARNLTVG